MKLNLPNKLTVLRLCLIPFFMCVILFVPDGLIMRLVAAALFGITAITDMFDGKIARKYNLVTDFGKFLDPVADKIMVIGACLALLTTVKDEKTLFYLLVCATFVVVLREIAVTSLRMIASSKVVIAANMAGKIKTVSQIVFILCMLLEPIFFGWCFIGEYKILTYASLIFMTFMTVLSGVNYLKGYWKFLDPQK